jgi:predicted dienelactone hydrolase
MTSVLRPILVSLVSLATLLVAAQAHAFEAGWIQIQTAGATPDAPMTTVALFYPTMAAPRVVAMGPFSVDAAIGGKPVDKVKALILLSHGNAGTELGHSVPAQDLARNGYLVAALRHPGDNWQDRSLIETSPERYLDERPRQASRAIDAILADPAWKARIATDSRGPLVGARRRWPLPQASTQDTRHLQPSRSVPDSLFERLPTVRGVPKPARGGLRHGPNT